MGFLHEKILKDGPFITTGVGLYSKTETILCLLYLMLYQCGSKHDRSSIVSSLFFRLKKQKHFVLYY